VRARLAAGMDEFLSKPIDVTKLHEVLERFLKQRSEPAQAISA
jgi:YesN/AraC family two-component response regulator